MTTTMTKWAPAGALALALALATATPARAQNGGNARTGEDGRPRIRAVRADAPPEIDGRLDEPLWERISPVTGFVQRDPVDGAEPTEPTEVRVAFDRDHLYVAFRNLDREPGAIRRSILHREGRIDQDDRVIIALDTYHDRRNAYIFELNPFGTQGDAVINDESMTLSDWNWEGVYESEATITEEGWELEVAIPFTTIRFAESDAPTMGIAFYRSIRRKSEDVTFPHIGQEYRSGISQVSRYAVLEGLEDLRRGRHVEVKPFAIAGAQKLGDQETTGLDDVGLDVKWGITSNLTADLTWNTDFAQVESDNVQINLTRFNLFFPEKREFFLERAGLFTFGEERQTELFFSRRIGLGNDIIGGGRVTGQVGPISVGALSLQTDDRALDGGVTDPGANNSVVRLRADVLPRTTVGGIVTSLEGEGDASRSFGADVSSRFWSSSSFTGWWAGVREGGATSSAGRAELELRNDRYSASASYTDIARDFAPALGFVRRPDQVAWSGSAAFFPRFESSGWARQTVHSLRRTVIDGQDGRPQSRTWFLHNMLSFRGRDALSLNVSRDVETLWEPTPILGRTLEPGTYAFSRVSTSFRTSESRTLSGRVAVDVGDFWSGTRTGYEGVLTWKTGPHLTLSGQVRRNEIDLPVEDGTFNTTVLTLDVLGAVSRSLFANALVQWDDVSEELKANVRIDWIHTPGSDLFLVLDTGYLTGDLLDPRATRWSRRTGVVKLTYMKAF